MDREMLIKRLKSKSYKRKMHLFFSYPELISSGENVRIIVDEIHADLGEKNLINNTDIYYCRRHFMKNKRNSFPKNIQQIKTNAIENKDSNFEDLTWTNPADLERSKLKSKFAKKETL